MKLSGKGATLKNLRLIIFAATLFGVHNLSWAQTALKEISTEYDKQYSTQGSYSILYDNVGATTKIKDFKVEFYGPNLERLAVSEIETYPLTGTTQVYLLSEPIEGFQIAKLIIYTLYTGEISDILVNPSIGLNQLSEFKSPNSEITGTGNGTVNKTDELAALRNKIIILERDLENQIKALNLNAVTPNKSLAERDAIIAGLEGQRETLMNENSILVGKLETKDEELAKLTKQIKTQPNLIKVKDQQIDDLQVNSEAKDAQITLQAEEIKALKAKIENQGVWRPAAIALGLLSLCLGGLLLFRRKPKRLETGIQKAPTVVQTAGTSYEPFGQLTKTTMPPRSSKAKQERPSKPLERPDDVGVLFSGSPLLAANVAAPLSTAGQLTASSLQMLSGQFAALRPAYQATGRIGYAQVGKPSGEDYAFGTGFLVSPNHVITNRHVHGFYSEYLTGADCGGIEFIAEKDKDASDFYEFDGNPPVLVPGLDIAIYTLAKSVNNREPIAIIPLPTDGLEGREIVVVGYPDTFNPDDPELLKALEKNPIFAVKRISQGHIFRHSTDTDDPYGVEAMVTENKNREFLMPSICHNASTMTGNSGSPILDVKTGELLGVHFAGYKTFNKKEAANLAMAIAHIVDRYEAHSPNFLPTKSQSKESTGLNTA